MVNENSEGPERISPIDATFKRLQELENQIRAKIHDPAQIARDMYARERLTHRERGHRAIDKLTGLYAPFLFQESLEREVEGVKRSEGNSGLGLALLDIDDFGAFNKLRGKQTGDVVLNNVGSVIKKTIRRRDIAFREGGEEEAVLMPYDNLTTPATTKTDPGDRLRRAIEKSFTKEGDRVTVSVGKTDLIKGETSKEFYIRADRARRIAKKLGKNRTVLTTIDNGNLIAHDLKTGIRYLVEPSMVEKPDEDGKTVLEEVLNLTPAEKIAA